MCIRDRSPPGPCLRTRRSGPCPRSPRSPRPAWAGVGRHRRVHNRGIYSTQSNSIILSRLGKGPGATPGVLIDT
eukprot:15451537-Alexandrium_andersonii.AAC.1